MKKISFMLGFIACAVLGTGCNGNKTGYAGGELFDKVTMERSSSASSATLRVGVNGPWELYAGSSTDKISMSESVLEGEGDGSFEFAVTPERREYYQFVNGENMALLAERHLALEGTFNFRDLGGYPTKDGKHIKWGKLFRSDDLHGLTPADKVYLGSIPIVSVVDFRAQQEADNAPDRLPSADTRYYPLPIAPGDMSDVSVFGELTSEKISGLMEQMNVQFVSTPEFVARYREFFRILQDGGNIPLVFHCSAGKDRTGMGAALILSALGVDEGIIMGDYLLSNEYIISKYASYIGSNPELEPLFSVRREYLQAGMDEIRGRYGSVEAFLTGELGVDLASFRRMYLD